MYQDWGICSEVIGEELFSSKSPFGEALMWCPSDHMAKVTMMGSGVHRFHRPQPTQPKVGFGSETPQTTKCLPLMDPQSKKWATSAAIQGKRVT